MVFIHGYRACSGKYYQLVPHLVKHFRLIFIDWIGAGCSSRPDNFNQKATPAEAMKYFIDYIESWRVQMKLDKFYLMGHSFGGYIASHYAIAHPERIQKLIICSVPGVSKKLKQNDKQKRPDHVPNMDFSKGGDKYAIRMLILFASDLN